MEAKSSFLSIRANTAIFAECYYYEVTLLSNGLMQIGWCTLTTEFTHENGVGDSPHSYAYDGYRVKKWNEEHLDYGQRWQVGDVIGTMLNLRTREILFWRNSEFLGVAFSDVKVGGNKAYFPGVSLQSGQRVVCNFGQRPFQNFTQPFCARVNEPDILINGYLGPGIQIMGYLKDYVMTMTKVESSEIALDDRLAVGCLLLEYLKPLMEDQFFMEHQVLQFLLKLGIFDNNQVAEVAFKVLDLSFADD